MGRFAQSGAELREVCKDLLRNDLCASALVPRRIRTRLYRLCGVDAHPTVRVESRCLFFGGSPTIGPRSYINHCCFFDAYERITIGADCAIAYRVTLSTATHEPRTGRDRAGKTLGKPVSIGDGCWIGAGSHILPGVTLGDRVLVGAGSVVTRDFPSDSTIAGNPARAITGAD